VALLVSRHGDRADLGASPALGVRRERPRLPWAAMRNRPLTLAEKQAVREFYSAAYAVEQNYVDRHPWHRVIAEYRVAVASAVFPELGKVLDAGCAGGDELLAFRAEGVEAFGFDVNPDLHDTVYPQARAWVRMGRFDYVPFSRADGFRTLVSYDVLEHVPVDELERFPAELERLGVTQLALIVSKETESDGHVTIQDTDWWVALLARAGFRLRAGAAEALDDLPAPAGWDAAAQRVLWARYNATGTPRNGWNQVPGHLFFQRG
jgi:hypothetical protein